MFHRWFKNILIQGRFCSHNRKVSEMYSLLDILFYRTNRDQNLRPFFLSWSNNFVLFTYGRISSGEINKRVYWNVFREFEQISTPFPLSWSFFIFCSNPFFGGE